MFEEITIKTMQSAEQHMRGAAGGGLGEGRRRHPDLRKGVSCPTCQAQRTYVMKSVQKQSQLLR